MKFKPALYSFLYFLTFFSSIALADETRPSSISGTAQYGNAAYSSYDLAGKVGVDKVFRLDASLLKSASDASPNTTGLELGFDAKASKSINLSLDYIGTKDANNIKSSGLAPGLDWDLSDLWNAETTTTISLDLEFSNYSQSKTPSDRTKTLGSKFHQNVITLGLEQDLNDSWTVMASVTKDNYTNLSASSARLLGKNKGQSKAIANAASSSFQGLVNGLPQNSFSFGITRNFSERWSLEAKYTHEKLVFSNSQVDEPELELSFSPNKIWTIALSSTYSKQEYEQAILAAGPTLSYNF